MGKLKQGNWLPEVLKLVAQSQVSNPTLTAALVSTSSVLISQGSCHWKDAWMQLEAVPPHFVWRNLSPILPAFSFFLMTLYNIFDLWACKVPLAANQFDQYQIDFAT